MKYISTRSNYSCNSLQAVLSGISPDGGLFISPEILSSPFDWRSVIGQPTLEMARLILSHLLPDFNDMEDLVQKAYRGKFETEDLTPLVKVGDKYVLELFRGPTSAFKDVALSMLPQLITAAKKQTGDKNETVILTATSGDTGKAALEGFHDVPGTRIIVFYPDGGVSPIQRAQMVTQEGSNVRVCAVRGNFDDCQTAVKQTFAKVNAMEELKNAGKTLSSANSINIGRLAPQVVYYFKAYSDLVGENRISLGDQIDFVVPSGNFGDILAGYFAKLLGLPVRHLICASNENRVLTDFLTTGLYDRQRPFYRTSSPSMDILVSSNLERLLFLACGCDAEQVRSWMSDLSSKGSFKVPASVLKRITDTFKAYCCTEKETISTIGETYRKDGYLCDPHTAVGIKAAGDYMNKVKDNVPVVVLSTASPYKFPAPVSEAIGLPVSGDEFFQIEQISKKTGVPVPKNLSSLESKKELHDDVIDRTAVMEYVLQVLGI
ncbi:MAG: threonine synthase [Spirochaetales bacterium]|nr:threonine synthase [Spirochaetales bacterium]MBR6234442.1 threonine synthase [Spirochaetales bacterium]